MPNLKPLWVIIGVLGLALVGLQLVAIIPAHAASPCPSTASAAKLAVVTPCPSISPSLEPVLSTPLPSDPAAVLPPTTGDGSSQPHGLVLVALGLVAGLLVGVICGSFVGLRRRSSDPGP